MKVYTGVRQSLLEHFLELNNILKLNLSNIQKKSQSSGKHTCQDVWGKEVRIINKNNEEKIYPLQNWYITLKYDDNTTIDKLIENFSFLAKQKELAEFIKFQDKHPEVPKENIVIEQLCDWQWLTDDHDMIVRKDNSITLVKYAVVVEKNV